MIKLVFHLLFFSIQTERQFIFEYYVTHGVVVAGHVTIIEIPCPLSPRSLFHCVFDHS